MVKYIHKTFPEVILMGGNVVTAGNNHDLLQHGPKSKVGPSGILYHSNCKWG